MRINSIPAFFKVLFLCVFALYGYHLFLDFYIDDAALYAALSKRMVASGDYISLVHNGLDWLDKPHFPFWMTALFFKLFGISSVVYYLPLTLSIFLTFFYTYQFATRFYSEKIAWLSVLILAASQYLFMASTEGRVEPYLMLCIIASLYHFDKAYETQSRFEYTMVAVFTAIAIMTKGIFIMIPIFGGIFGHYWFKEKGLRFLFHWRWIWLGILIFLFILPEIYALYLQFDSQPNKVVFGSTNVSGIRWFLWDSQFSRLVNSGPITRSSGDVFFYFHTLLWAFFPWCFVLYGSLIASFASLFRKEKISETYTLFGSLFILLIFSISKFQLPHYTTVIFPLFSILCAKFVVVDEKPWKQKVLKYSLLLSGILSLALFLAFLIFIQPSFWFYILFIAILMFTVIIFRAALESKLKFVALGVIAVLSVNIVLSGYVLPEMSKFRGGLKAANYVNSLKVEKEVLVVGQVPNFVNFYVNKPFKKVKTLDGVNLSSVSTLILYDSVGKLDQHLPANFELAATFDHYPSESLSLAFFSPEKRQNILTKFKVFRKR